MDFKKVFSSPLLFILLLIISLSACENGEKGDGRAERAKRLPDAQGGPREIILLMDSVNWYGPLGEEVRTTFEAPIPGMLKDEPMFKLFRVDPLRMTTMLMESRNLIYVTTLDNDSRQARKIRSYFTPQSIQMIREDTGRFLYLRKDVHARNQYVMNLVGTNADALAENIADNRTQLREYFKEAALQAIKSNLRDIPDRKVMGSIEENYNFTMLVPRNYYIARRYDELIWVRSPDIEIDKSVFVYSQPYTSEEIFRPENILNLRDSLTRRYLYDMEDKSLVMEVEPLLPLYIRPFNFNGNYAVEVRGMWKLNKQALGGPFVSYLFVDEASGRLFMADGFVIAPGEDKAKPIFEVEAMLSSIRIEAPDTVSAQVQALDTDTLTNAPAE